MNKRTNQFLEKYEAHASLSDRKHYAKRMPMSLNEFHKYNTAMDVYEYESFLQREPYVEMYVPQHRFEEMVMQDEFYTAMSQKLDYATDVINEKIKDEMIRKSNPAVKKAYEKYQMLLEIARK